MEKGIGDGEGEGGRECKTEEEWEILSTVREMGERGVESIEDGGSCGGVGEGIKDIGFDARELERSNGLSCRTDSIYLGFFLKCCKCKYFTHLLNSVCLRSWIAGKSKS